MDLSARHIHDKQFHDAWRGYNQEEVDDFLDRVAEVLDRVQRENLSLHQRMRELDQTVATSREAEEMLKKTLVTAQQAAEEAIGKAKAKAEQLIGEAEERARRASEETRTRASQAEAEMRRKSTEQERDFATRKREIDSAIERLRAYEQDLRTRLKSFLEQQLRALQTLPEQTPPKVAGPSARGPGAQRGAPHPTPAPEPSESKDAPAESRPTSDRGPGVVRVEDAEEPAPTTRRSVRGLFWRDEG
ncbi:MAG: DivIVA domain-containing protein [Actinomycetota bacterium]